MIKPETIKAQGHPISLRIVLSEHKLFVNQIKLKRIQYCSHVSTFNLLRKSNFNITRRNSSPNETLSRVEEVERC